MSHQQQRHQSVFNSRASVDVHPLMMRRLEEQYEAEQLQRQNHQQQRESPQQQQQQQQAQQQSEARKYGDHLYGAIPLIVDNTTLQQTGLVNVIEYFQQRSVIERDYSMELKKHARSFQVDTIFSGSMEQVMSGVKGMTERLAARHSNFAKDIQVCMCDPLTEFNNDLTQSKKRLMTAAQRLEKDLSIGLNAVEKNKQRQHKIARDSEQTILKAQKALSGDSISKNGPQISEKVEQSVQKAVREAKIAEMQYADTVKQMRLYQQRFKEDMKNILNTFQNNDVQLLQIAKTFLLHYITFEEHLVRDFLKDLEAVKTAVQNIEPNTILNEFIDKNATNLSPPEPIPYEPYVSPAIARAEQLVNAAAAQATSNYTEPESPTTLKKASSASHIEVRKAANNADKKTLSGSQQEKPGQWLQKWINQIAPNQLKIIPRSTAEEEITIPMRPMRPVQIVDAPITSSTTDHSSEATSSASCNSEPNSPRRMSVGERRSKEEIEEEHRIQAESLQKERQLILETQKKQKDQEAIIDQELYNEFSRISDHEFRKDQMDINQVKQFESMLAKIFAIGNATEKDEIILLSEIADLTVRLETREEQKTRLALAMAMNHIRADPCIDNEKAFSIVAQLVTTAMNKAHEFGDANVGRLFLNMSQTFYRTKKKGNVECQEYLQQYLRDLEIWKDIRFWEGAFFDALSYERKKSDWGDKKRWRYLDKDQRAEVVVHHENMVFGLLGSFSFNMLNMGVTVPKCREFMEKMCMINSLKDEYTELLMTSIDTTYISIRASETSTADLPSRTRDRARSIHRFSTFGKQVEIPIFQRTLHDTEPEPDYEGYESVDTITSFSQQPYGNEETEGVDADPVDANIDYDGYDFSDDEAANNTQQDFKFSPSVFKENYFNSSS